MNSVLTKTRLRRIAAEGHGIEMNSKQLQMWINKGLLPDPHKEPWTEEAIVPRFLHAHELTQVHWSVDRRVVQLQLDRFAVPPSKLQPAMAGMIPTIGSPTRKMARMRAASVELDTRGDRVRNAKRTTDLAADWRIPEVKTWAELLLQAEPAWFAHRVGTQFYFVAVLNDPNSRTAPKLTDIPLVEQVTLLMAWNAAHRRDHQQLIHDQEALNR